MLKTVKLINIGRMGYEKTFKLQKLISEAVRTKQSRDILIAVEHDPVYTVGIRDKVYTIEEEKKLRDLGAEFHRTNRGGLITFHGPGQLVVYPIIDLRNFQPSVRWYVCQLEKTIIRLCAEYGIQAYTSPHTGVWVDDMKICALGIHASRYITTHGLALNCNTDLAWFTHIIPCGIQGKTVTSISKQLNKEVTIKQVLPKFEIAFSEQFECLVENITPKSKFDETGIVQLLRAHAN